MFRNLTLFRFSRDVATDLQRLDEVLADHRLRACGPLEMFTHGFVPPVGIDAEAPLTRTVLSTSGRFTWFTVGAEDKLLPSAVVNDALAAKVRKIADEEGRRVGGRERKRLREALLTDMLPRAFVRSSRLGGYVDTNDGWLLLDTASRKAAENAVTQLREALGSLPVVPLAPDESPRVLMTDWLANDTLPAGLALGDECELRDPATSTGARWRGRNEDLTAEDVREHLRNGKQVFKLGLVFEDRISFVLGEDLVLRKVKFLDVVLDELGDSYEDGTAEMDAAFAIYSGELARLLERMAVWFALPRPSDEGAA